MQMDATVLMIRGAEVDKAMNDYNNNKQTNIAVMSIKIMKVENPEI